MKIAYLAFHPHIASARLRQMIPGRAMREMGHEVTIDHRSDADWIVLSKHDWPEFDIKARRVVFDVCDDHFHDAYRAHYMQWCERADVVTCNSETMASVIRCETGRDAVVIDDPYETPESAPKCHSPVLWFGMQHNLAHLMPILDKLPPTMIVTDAPGYLQWSPQQMNEAFAVCGLVVIPTGHFQAKSANRAIESIRRGVFPVCGSGVPAYAELGLGCDDVPAGVMDALENPERTKALVAELQALVRERFSPQAVAKRWLEAMQ